MTECGDGAIVKSSGASYYCARYYDQTLGRFLSEDPLGFTTNTVNFYGYVHDNPVNSTDPMGLQPKSSGGVWGKTAALVETTTSFWWQFYRGSMDMWMNYEDMRKANTIGADKYFHCMANCEAAKRGPGGVLAAQVISDLREDYGYWKGDPMGDSMDDMRANRCGRRGARDCTSACKRYVVRGLDVF